MITSPLFFHKIGCERDSIRIEKTHFFALKHTFFILFLSLFVFIFCKENYTPKPRGYFRIDFPQKEYFTYKSECPYKFAFPVYSKVVPDTDRLAQPCWLNINFAQFKAHLHLTYHSGKENLLQAYEDSRKLAMKHIPKADNIEEKFISEPEKKVYGILYNIEGDAASPVQFYLTDSVNNFVRGSLYFTVEPNIDSLKPVIEFLKTDILYLIDSFEWR